MTDWEGKRQPEKTGEGTTPPSAGFWGRKAKPDFIFPTATVANGAEEQWKTEQGMRCRGRDEGEEAEMK